jgi:hypothetical protein
MAAKLAKDLEMMKIKAMMDMETMKLKENRMIGVQVERKQYARK